VPAGFPPFLDYRLRVDDAPVPGRPGIDSVRDPFKKRPPAPYLRAVSDLNRFYRSWFAALGARATTNTFVDEPRQSRVRWRGRDDLRRQVRQAARAFDAPFRSLVRELQRADALTAAEARAACPHVALTMFDVRSDQSQRLPTATDLLPPPR